MLVFGSKILPGGHGGGIGLLTHWHPNWSNLKLPGGHDGGKRIIVVFSHLHIPGIRKLSGGQRGTIGIGGIGGGLILTQPYTTRSSS